MGTINLKIPFLNFLLVTTIITAPIFAIAYHSSIVEALSTPKTKCKPTCTTKKERARLGKMPTPKSKRLWQRRKKSLKEGFTPILEVEEEDEKSIAMEEKINEDVEELEEKEELNGIPVIEGIQLQVTDSNHDTQDLAQDRVG
ncbi:hypothetical protein TWF569_004640 [Orbilia oligospora]|nr:hypothetical protein TWF706_002059 [Orbilia oligospora]KAF3133373.1 hypothetical protein TWF703_006912 [Orbilia oligospora]KAF3150229.1 hypothetical protein TWF594_010107 [Orbilia oligospora]KAF3150243.1 hypothetical protein TWF569_004640 [Orbilia oligospora]